MMKALVSLVVLATASVASAALVCEVTENTSPGAGLSSYTIWFNGDTAGDALNSFVGRIDGPLRQVWGVSWGSVYKTPYGDSNPASDEDSRLLLNQGWVTSVAGYYPDEDSNITPAGDGLYPGYGTYLAATATTDMLIAITPAYQQIDTAFARVVMATGDEVTLTGEAAAADEVQKLDLNVVIPEPATVGLLAVGAVVALLRRRR